MLPEICLCLFPVENSNGATAAFVKKSGKIETRDFLSRGWDRMRDIRSDLEERVFLIEAQIAATSTDFENAVEQLKNKLRADIASLGVALLAEQYRNYLADTIPGDGPQ
jgi:hypothetical protein